MFKRENPHLHWFRAGRLQRLRGLLRLGPRTAEENVFVPSASFEIVNEIAAPIFAVATETDEIYMCGTATIIGPGYAITAAHVIEDFNNRFGSKIVKGGVEPNYRLMIFTFYEGKGILQMQPLYFGFSQWTDIAILYFGLPPKLPIKGHRWKRLTMQLHPPALGERISAFGYVDPNRKVIARDEWHFEMHPRSSTGKVVEIHHPRRDAVRLSFPCFRVDARFDGSMSGGPVFNSSGNLCGIICSSLSSDSDCEEHISYATTLWPLLGMPVPACDGAVPAGSFRFGYEYFDLGLFHAVDRDQFRVHFTPGQTDPSGIQYLEISRWRRLILSSARGVQKAKRQVAAKLKSALARPVSGKD